MVDETLEMNKDEIVESFSSHEFIDRGQSKGDGSGVDSFGPLELESGRLSICEESMEFSRLAINIRELKLPKEEIKESSQSEMSYMEGLL